MQVLLPRSLTFRIRPQGPPDSLASRTLVTAISYLRVSTEDQGKKGYSLPEQQALCLEKAREQAQAYAEEQGCELELHVAEFTDTVSGDFRNRPQLQEALEYLRRSRAQWWVCLDPDRFSRKLKIQLDVAEEIEAGGAELVFVHYTHEDSPEGWAFFQMRGVFSELDKKKILRRLKAGVQRKLKDRQQLAFGIQMYGYRFARDTDCLVVDSLGSDGRPARDSPAYWVLAWKQWCGLEGMTPEQVSRRYYSLTGRYVSRQTIRTVLARQCYATGRYTVNQRDWTGYTATKILNRQLPPAARQKLPRPQPKPGEEHVEIAVPAFVPAELQAAVDETLRRTARRTPRDGQVRMLQGLGRCCLCGGNLYYGPRGSAGLMLTCRHKTPQTRKLNPDHPRYRSPCPLPSKLATRVEDVVWQQVVTAILNPAILMEEAAARAQAVGPDPGALRAELRDAERRLAEISDERVRYGLLFAKQVWTMAEVEKATAPLDRQQQALQERKACLAAQLAEMERAQKPPQALGTARELNLRGAEALNRLPRQQRREFILDLVDHFRLMPGKRGQAPVVQIHWR